jgi:hypothetical protein
MKYFIASISDNYPFKLYGEFISDNDFDYLIFLEGEKIQKMPSFKIVFNITKEDTKLYKWNVLAVNRSFYMIDEKVKNLLAELCENSFEFLNANAETKDGYKIHQYYILNVLNNNKIIFRDKDTRIIFSETFVLEFKNRKLKGLTFYPID